MPTLLTRTSRGRTAALAAAVLTGLAMAAPASAAPADSRDIPTEGLLASYDFSAESGAVLADRSGNDRDGAVVGTPSWHGGYMHFDGQNYVELPDGMLAEEQAATVIIETAPQHLGGAQFLWNFGGSGDEATGQFFIQPVDPRVSISASNYTAEQTAQAEQDLQEGTWQSIAATIAPNPGGQTSTLRLYVDGELWAEKTDSTTNLDDLTTHTMNYIGQSAYRPDSLYQGKVSAFHMYNRALSQEQLAAVAEADAPAAAAETAAVLDLQAANDQDLSRIEFDITLPTAGGITWSSEPAGIIAPDGTVTQPPETTDVTLTATVNVRGHEATAEFPVTVLQAPTDAQRALRDLEQLSIPHVDDVRSSLTLPQEGSLYGSTITWDSSAPEIIDAHGSQDIAPGVVTRPAEGDRQVTLTASATYAGTTRTRDIEVTVRQAYDMPETTDYLFAHFTGLESSHTDEQIYFATSHDARTFTDTRADGDPVLSLAPDEGDGGVRDPFLIRSPEGDKFYLIATNLSIYHRGGWGAAQATTTGSTQMVVWESTDLVHWSEPRFPDVAGPIPEAGMLWAPEAFWDEKTQQYYVYWATRADGNTDLGDSVDIYLSTTRDFRTFSDPVKWIDRQGSIIDTTMIKVGDWYYRASGDGQITIERSQVIETPTVSPTAQETGTEEEWVLVGTLQSILDGSGDCSGGTNYTGACLEGPEFFEFNADDTPEGTDLYGLLADQYAAGRGYVPFTTTDISSTSAEDWSKATEVDLGELKKRHGGILPITAAEYDRVMEHYAEGGGQPETSLEVEAGTRCLAGSAYVTARVTNTGDEPVDVTISTDFGSRTVTEIEPGRAASAAFNARTDTVPAGAVAVTSADGESSAAYEEASC